MSKFIIEENEKPFITFTIKDNRNIKGRNNFTKYNILERFNKNCQSNFVSHLYDLVNPADGYTLEDRKEFLRILYQKTNKSQIVIDVEQKWIEPLKKGLKPFYKKFYTKRYISTNTSKMAICIIQLNIKKLNNA